MEKQAAKKLADIFSDERLNVVGLAHETFDVLGIGAEMRVREWLDWHDRLCSTGAGAFDGQLEFDYEEIPF